MDTNTYLYAVTGGLLLILTGIIAYPYMLSYRNTSWMPRWMRPGVDYLERAYDYAYPADLPRSAFCQLLMAAGFVALAGGLIEGGWQTFTVKAFGCLTLLFPCCIVCRTFALRTLKVDGCMHYSDAVTRPRSWKTGLAIGIPAVLFVAYSADLLPFTLFRISSLAYSLAVTAFLAWDFHVVYRERVRNDYSTHRLSFADMRPESHYMVFFLVVTGILQAYLWTGLPWLPCVFCGVVTFSAVAEYALRFHPDGLQDYRERAYHYMAQCGRRWLSVRRAEELCRLAARGRGIFREDGGRTWHVLVCRNPHYYDYLYTCTSNPDEQMLLLEEAGEEIILSRSFATLREAFDFRLEMMRKYERIHREILCREEQETERLFEKELRETEVEYSGGLPKKVI